MSTNSPGPQDPFTAARQRLAELSRHLSGPPADLLAMAKAYAALASAMLELARAQGQTSMRFEAVVKALDLTTPKSALRQFLDNA